MRRRPAPYYGCHALIRIDDAAAGRKLVARLLPYVVSAADYASREVWVALALTFAGLRALGLPRPSLDSFPLEFRQGMAARAPLIGDTGANDPKHWDAPYGSGDVHIALTLLSVSADRWQMNLDAAQAQLDALPGVKLLVREDFAQMSNGRTPFGYRDGISFPTIEGSDLNPIPGGGTPIAAGEIVLGYPAQVGRRLQMPQPEVLGRNGTFAGFRKLHSRVAAFRRFLRANATATMSEELLAAKMAGRWRSGAPLALAPERDDPQLGEDMARTNDFGYTNDVSGLRCPLGAHIRRMNPRDTHLPVMTDVTLHRIIRHGTTYGSPLPEGAMEDDGVARGLFFIFLSANAPQTFEFLRRQWIDDGNFIGLGNEKDPLAGGNDGSGTFTIPMKPIRRRLHGLERFTVTRGGEYAFLPSLSALRWISEL